MIIFNKSVHLFVLSLTVSLIYYLDSHLTLC